jgi:CBS domain-containing protein
MKVREIMHNGVTWEEPGTPVVELAQKMRAEDIGAIPIGENDRLVGMVTDRDIVTRAIANGKNLDRLTARDVMSNNIFYCRTDSDIGEAVRIMGKHCVRRLPVINEHKRLVGMLSLGDISAASDQALSARAIGAVAMHHP